MQTTLHETMHTSEAENFVVLIDVANHPQTREIEMADLFSCNIKTEAVRRSVQNQKGLINRLSVLLHWSKANRLLELIHLFL